jgi:DNA-binding NarL/FixJ family response regulator
MRMTVETETPAPLAPVTDIKVAIIEDHHKLRECLEFLLNNTEGYRCTGSFRSMEEALEKISFDLPDLALLDIGLPGMTGVERGAVETATSESPDFDEHGLRR